MFGLGVGELVVILVIVLVLFGPGRLPELGGALGEGIKNFRKGYRDSKSLDVTPPSDAPASSAPSSSAPSSSAPASSDTQMGTPEGSDDAHREPVGKGRS